MHKVGFISLGCPKNLVDSEVMMGQLQQKGYQITADAEDADTVVVNTCGFIESAKKESIEAILEAARLKTEGKAKRLIVAGCLVERYRDELKAEMPEVDAFIGTNQINDILSVCDPQTNTRSLPVIPLGNQSATYLYDESTPRVLATPSHYAFIKIAEGCDRPCAFCFIPQMRGHFRSRRFGSIVAEDQKAVKYLDMPLQHASQNVLKLMKRVGHRGSLERLIERVRKRVPGIAVRTTFITGFPGETEEDFNELLTFVGHVEFDRVGVFTYSDEEGSPAFELSNKVDPKIAKRRRDRLMKEQSKIAKRKHGAMIGKTVRVLFEGES